MTNDSRSVGFKQRAFDAERAHSGGCGDADKFSSGRWQKRQSVSSPYVARAAHSLYFQHNPNPRIRDMTGARSETEGGLQFEFTIGRSAGRERTTLQRIGNIKESGPQHRVGIGRVHVVKNVAGIHPQCEIETAI